jgi:hypothetical protein
MGKKIKTLKISDVVAQDLDNYGYSYKAPKPFSIPIDENILVNHPSFLEPYVARFVQMGKDLVLIT